MLLANRVNETAFRLLHPDGAGGVETKWLVSETERSSVLVAELDGDDSDDLVYCSRHSNRCEVALVRSGQLSSIDSLHRGDAPFGAMPPSKGHPARLFLAEAGRWWWYAVYEAGMVRGSTLDVPIDAPPVGADFDGDGLSEIAVVGDGVLRLLRPDSEGIRFETIASASVPGQAVPSAVANLDADTAAELLMFEENRGLSYVRFSPAGETTIFESMPEVQRSRPAVGDLDGDGRPDLVSGWIGSSLPDGSPDPTTFRLLVMAQIEPDVFVPRYHELSSIPGATGLLDIDDDGDLDVLLSTENEIQLLANDP